MYQQRAAPFSGAAAAAVLLLVTYTCVCNALQDWCYTTDPAPYRQYASYTPYYDSQGVPEAVEQHIEGCSALHLYYLNRHGTRHPEDDIAEEQYTVMPALRDRILQNHQQGRGSLCEEDLARLQTWKPRTQPEDVDGLAETGWQELRDLADRFTIRYPDLLGLDYTNVTAEEHYYFRHTDAHRTKDTSRAFAEGLFGYYEGVEMIEVPVEEDNLLRFYKNCDKYIETVENQPNVEKELFLAGPEVAAMIAHVETRLGFNAGELSWDLVFSMYDNCRLDYGIYADSPWCSTVTSDDLEVINYSEDLEFYYEKTYGHEINYEMACELIVDIIQHFDEAVVTQQAATSLHFAHGSTCFALTARMGLYNDTVAPLASNYDDRHNRVWDTTYQLPMATNFAYALYGCDGSGVYPEGHYVRFHHMEEAVVIPGCSGVMCPYEELTALWSDIVTGCDLDVICAYP